MAGLQRSSLVGLLLAQDPFQLGERQPAAAGEAGAEETSVDADPAGDAIMAQHGMALNSRTHGGGESQASDDASTTNRDASGDRFSSWCEDLASPLKSRVTALP